MEVTELPVPQQICKSPHTVLTPPTHTHMKGDTTFTALKLPEKILNAPTKSSQVIIMIVFQSQTGKCIPGIRKEEDQGFGVVIGY